MRQWIDSHMHVWDPTRMHYPWLSAQPSLRRPYLPDDLDTCGHEILGAVIVEAGRLSHEARDEARWVAALAERWPWIVAMVAHVPLEWGDTARSRLTELSSGHPLVVGVRRNIQDEPLGFALGDGFIRGVRLLANYGYTLDLCVRRQQLPEMIELATRVPEVVFVLDHLGKPAVAAQNYEPWRDDLARLAGHPNVVCKLSGLTTEADHGRWRPDDVLPYLRHALHEFGPDRVMFGGDWPVATLATGYGRWADIVEGLIADLPAAQRDEVAVGTASRVYRLPGG